MARIVLVLGGARSGKSSFAEKLVRDSGLERVYLATGRAWDGEMRQRIEKHVADRGAGWLTVETPLDLVEALDGHASDERAILVDCLTLWVTNLMLEERDVDAAYEGLERALKHATGLIILVSNEVGWGIVPENAMAREFRDHAGRLHQRIAAIADEAYLVAAGLPLRLK